MGFRQPPPCRVCPRCGTNLTPDGAYSHIKVPHEFYDEDMVLSEDGALIAPVGVCKYCGMIDDLLPRLTAIV